MGYKDLNNGLVKIMENYLIEKNKPFKNNFIANFLRRNITEIIRNNIKDLSENDFWVEGSPGRGNWAEIPWICIFNSSITKSAQKGIYLVFLFSADMKKVYLSLNQGFTFYRDNKIINKIPKFTNSIRSIISDKYDLSNYLVDINLNAEGNYGRGYEDCNIISKRYLIEDLKENRVDIQQDLLELISIYDYLYINLPNKDIDLFYKSLYEKLETDKNLLIAEENNYSTYESDINSKKMVSHIFDYIESKGFIFDIEDIANFYLSMKVKPFVLLAGISGTGKSKLVELFANGIGATTDNGRYRLISVKPDWNDGTELFGYIDINGEYVPGILVEILYEANKVENLNKPYIVCLDEMNLARVEYYLSDYLSIIETRHRKDGKIRTNKIFPKGYFKSSNKYADIYFSDNIILVGTVNMDDTTFAFSEKVLDRANTIEFSQVNLEFLDFHNKEIESVNLDNKNFTTSYLTIKEAFNDDKNFVKKVNNKIIEIHNILKKYNRHFGYRTRDEIVFYMLENEKEGLLTFEDAFDYQISQKVLPRINGSDYEIKEMLIKLFNHLNPNNELIDNPGYLSDIKFENLKYKKSSRKIIEMLRSYENGYVSFW